MTRALPVVLVSVLLVGGLIYAMSMGGEGAGGRRAVKRVDPSTLLGHDDPQGFPWELRELYRPPYGWRTVGYFTTQEMCLGEKGRRFRETGKRHECRRR